MAVSRNLTGLLMAAFALWAAHVVHAQGAPAQAAAAAPPGSGYNLPPKEVLDVMLAPSPPVPSVSPTKDNMLLISMVDYPSIARVATPFLRLAGVRVEPANHSKHDTPGGYGITPCIRQLELVRVPSGAQVPVTLPAGACPQRPLWSADGKQFAFANIASNAVELWIGETSNGAVHRISGLRLNPMFDGAVQWLDQKTLLVKAVPANIGPAPAKEAEASGPSIEQTGGEKGQSSTYEARDTLRGPHDEDVFDYYAQTQLMLVDAIKGVVEPIGKPGNYNKVVGAPDGRHILVTAIKKPYSYLVTAARFPYDVQVWDISERAHIRIHTLFSLPLADRVPIRGVPVGPRDFTWRQTEPATLVWAEALDGGDLNVNVPERDKVMMQKAPFTVAPEELTRTEHRFEGFLWGEQPDTALLMESDENRHWQRTFVYNVDQPQIKPRVLWDRSEDEHYADPGVPVTKMLPNGAVVVGQENDTIYLAGAGSSPNGDRPFLDRLNLKSGASERLFRSDQAAYEQFLSLTSSNGTTFLTWHQTPDQPPNAFLRTVTGPLAEQPGEAVVASSTIAVTHIADPTPAVRAIKKRLVKYQRADGLELSFILYTPPNYVEGTRVPTILYAYPQDYADPSKAGQVTGSQQTFTRLRDYRLLLLSGYAIIDRASFPVVGDPKRAYDTFIEQLVDDAKAAVDEAVRIGVADPDRIGVTGHSHGALMTVDLVAHSDLFRAGVATSGSYNKTLVPFGFQNERRSVWQATDVYLKVSPFFAADKIKTPLLLIHGAEDANPGTTPLESRLLYQAIRGNGGTSRLVMLPHEPHWYTALESNEQEAYEEIAWFDKYVKNAAPRATAAAH
jgi:dipeptidyl aminopeptidase/acylaminoacyl peptidase